MVDDEFARPRWPISLILNKRGVGGGGGGIIVRGRRRRSVYSAADPR